MQLPRLTRRVFADLALWMIAFGLMIGFVFPPFCVLLGVPSSVASRPPFLVSCLGAGLLVGTVSFALTRSVVGARVRRLANGMGTVRKYLAIAVDSGDFTGCDTEKCKLPVDSTDELGAVAESFNDLLVAVVRAHTVEHAIAAASTAVGRQLDAKLLAEAALNAVLSSTGARGGAVLCGPSPSLTTLARRGISADLLDPAHLAAPQPRPADQHPPLVVTPLHIGDELVGFLVLDLAGAEPPGLHRLLAAVGDTLAVALANAELHARMRHQARVDDLTGLANRRTGLALLAAELARVASDSGSVGILLIDIDHFKAVNDTFGHQVGDDVLRHLASTAASRLRQGDVLCRYGGEELLAVLPGADLGVVEMVAERVRGAVARTPFLHLSGPVPATISVGGTSTQSATIRLESFVNEADTALYEAKAAGRNQVRIACTDTLRGSPVPTASATPRD